MNVFKYLKYFFIPILLLLVPCPSHADSLDNWRAVTSPSDHWFYGITYGNGKFITVGDYGTVLTSSDGVAWTARTSGVTNHLYGVGYGNGTYVAAGTLGRIITSPDGITWTVRYGGQAHPLSQNLFGVAYGQIGLTKRFIAVGADGTILTSTDNGVNWSDVFWPYPSITDNWLYGAIYGSQFITVGSYDPGGPTYSEILSSSNGTNWSQQTSGTINHLTGVAYGNGFFTAVGYNGTVLTSSNGINWNVETPPVSDDLTGIAFGTVGGFGYFVAVGTTGTIITSQDGINWTSRDSGSSYDLEDVAYDSAKSAFATVGGHGIILLDGDGVPVNPVWNPSMHNMYLGNSIQVAYDNASDGDTILSQALHFNTNLTFDHNISVTLDGGYDSGFSTKPSATTINGNVTISHGTVVMENIVIQ